MRRSAWLGAVVVMFVGAVLYAGTAVEDLGVTKGEPIETGFLFVDGKYIDAPYVVERRGVSVYVNDIMIARGVEYPPYDYRVETDPGDPPADVPPVGKMPAGVDGRDTYWGKKARYIFQHYDEETARAMAIETYRKSPFVKEVIVYADDPITVTLVDEEGRSHDIGLWVPSTYMLAPPTPEEILKGAEESRLHWESLLEGKTTVIFCGKGGELGATREKALDMLEGLVSATTLDERAEAIGRAFPSRVTSKSTREMLSEFEASPQLAERYEAAKAAWEAEKAAKEAEEAARSASRRAEWEARQAAEKATQ